MERVATRVLGALMFAFGLAACDELTRGGGALPHTINITNETDSAVVMRAGLEVRASDPATLPGDTWKVRMEDDSDVFVVTAFGLAGWTPDNPCRFFIPVNDDEYLVLHNNGEWISHRAGPEPAFHCIHDRGDN